MHVFTCCIQFVLEVSSFVHIYVCLFIFILKSHLYFHKINKPQVLSTGGGTYAEKFSTGVVCIGSWWVERIVDRERVRGAKCVAGDNTFSKLA